MNTSEPIPIGTPVRILNSGYSQASILDFRGNFGPQGARVYTVCVHGHSIPRLLENPESKLVLEVLESQLETIPMEEREAIQAKSESSNFCCNSNLRLLALRNAIHNALNQIPGWDYRLNLRHIHQILTDAIEDDDDKH